MWRRQWEARPDLDEDEVEEVGEAGVGVTVRGGTPQPSQINLSVRQAGRQADG